MSMTPASHPSAVRALELVKGLQARLVAALEKASEQAPPATKFEPVSWLRDEGRHGGGTRFGAADTAGFNRASVNVSQVHYDDLEDKRLSSATAISAIVHPAPPRAPSMHMHVSWTHMRDGRGYWRVMGDLNPSHVVEEDKARFEAALRAEAPEHFDLAMKQGAQYFWIPALERTRGVAHFYLEAYATDSPEDDLALARRVGEATIDTYGAILADAYRRPALDAEARQRQIAYHTLYALQVLTLDRGTTSGLLIHDQNDIGIMGSIPSHLDRALLASWRERAPEGQRPLIDALVGCLSEDAPSLVDVATKQRFANAIRAFYAEHPEALELQAAGNTVPPTVDNHR